MSPRADRNTEPLTLITGGTGKTGRRVAERLLRQGRPVRIASRSSTPSFNWNDPAGWTAALDGVERVYLSFSPDLAVPGATGIISRFVDAAVAAGVRRFVLLSGRGEAEAQACEQIVQARAPEWTIVRASWFNQNFSEGEFRDMVLAGNLTLPAGEITEPFIDADDIAEVAAAALTGERHHGEVYEVTGPRLMTFAELARELSEATGREIRFTSIPHADFTRAVAASGAPDIIIWLMDYLFATVLDGRNAHLSDGVQRALGREPADFRHYARKTAASGVWAPAAEMTSPPVAAD